MDTEQRVLSALRCSEPDRVPVLIPHLNPYTSTGDGSYRELMAAAEEYADIIYNKTFTRQRSVYGNTRRNNLVFNEEFEITELDVRTVKLTASTPKGELCQIVEKDTFYGFVVYGPISQAYTDLNDYDAVFVYVPAGQVGYVHHANPTHIITLRDLVDSSKTVHKSHLL